MAKAKPAKPAKKTPRPQLLPGMEDNKIEALEEIALDYADVRDERIKLSQQEGELKGQLLQLMKAQKREHYQRGRIIIDIVHEEENVKVKVKSEAVDKEEPSHEGKKPAKKGKKGKATDFDPAAIQDAAKKGEAVN
jgi:hypothetical protein